MAYPRATWRIKGRMPAAPATRRSGAAVLAGGRSMGTWKLAYADFLTALAAFFLVMWLVKGMPESGRADIADYFETGAGTSQALAAPERPDAASLLETALLGLPAVRAHASQVAIARTERGVRIDFMDLSDEALFARGTDRATAHGEALMGEIFASLAALPLAVTLEGHTDAFPFQDGTGSNWSLSLARADTARRLAEASGIAPDRLRAVTGYGASRPRLPAEPHHAINRRVTVILHVPPLYSIPVSS